MTATGKYYGPGIGAADHSTCGNIVISTTGTVTSTGDYYAPGIGAPGVFEGCKCGDITIAGGTVIATGSYCSPGIGTDYYYKRSGVCGNITIADTITMVTAQGMNDSPGIYRPEDSAPYFTYGSHLDLVISDSDRLYTLTPQTFTVTWVDDDGTTLGTDTVAYGATPTCEMPSRADDAYSTYTFLGWTPAVASVTGDATYTAEFSHEVQLANLTGDYTAANGDVLTGTTTHNVTIPGGVTVTFNGVSVTGAGGDVAPEAPSFSADAEAATTKFEMGADGKWHIVAFAELATGTADGVEDLITILCGDEPNAVVTPVTPESLCTTNAVKVEAVVTPPLGKDAQFFKVKFGE